MNHREMNQSEKRVFLIKRLLQEQPRYGNMQIPVDIDEQKSMLRALMNIRMPGAMDDEFLNVQDEYLQRVNAEKGVPSFFRRLQMYLFYCNGKLIHSVKVDEGKIT